jgi:hypothetical protein
MTLGYLFVAQDRYLFTAREREREREARLAFVGQETG